MGISLFIGALVACLAAAVWLGWGRRSTWRKWSGWDRIDSGQKLHAKAVSSAIRSEPTSPAIDWLGHGSLRIKWGGRTILVDPVASSRITVAPRLFPDPMPNLDERADLVLLTHAHMDHLDPRTLAQVPPTRLLLPEGSGRFLDRSLRQRHQLSELAVGGPGLTLDPLRITAVPAAHGGWRYPWQRGLRACGYVIQHSGQALFVAGDTAYGPHFREIGLKHRPRWAVLPIGAYSPSWFLRIRHMDPREAAQAALDIGAEYVLPCHFGTYRVSLEGMSEPLPWFVRECQRLDIKWWLGVDEGAFL